MAGDDDLPFARRLWLRLETLHAVTYFAPEAVAASEALGVAGFWRGYFGFRAAPLGAASAGVVEATFSNFEPGFVAKRVPEVWSLAPPEAYLAARSTAAVAALRRLVPDIEAVAEAVSPDLEQAVDAGLGSGRPLFSANRRLPLPDEPVARLWQLCTSLREHRGDGHVAALTAAGIDGCGAHVLIALDQGLDPADLQVTRGWSPEAWAAATDRLVAAGLVSVDGTVPTAAGGATLAPAGHAVRREVEATTDRLAEQPFAALDATARARLVDALTPAARAVSTSGTIRYPNPMGLPPIP